MIAHLRAHCLGICLGTCLLFMAVPAAAKEKPTKGLRYASLTPDGKSVVFCYRGDVWVAPTAGGHAERLTIHEEQETLARVSPDGKQIAFVSRRNGAYDIFTIPIGGGMPKQVTFHSAVEILCDWHPDGKRLLFMSNRDADMGRLDLYEVDLEGGTPRRITYDGGREASYSKDGSQIVYVRGFNNIYWDNYKGSANFDIYVIDAKGGTPRRVTDTEDNERWPNFSADGRTVYFVGEEDGVANFYSVPVEGGKRTQVTKYKVNDVHRPDVGWDHKTAVFEIVGQLYTVDLTAPAEKPTPLKLEIDSDVRNSGIEVRTITSGGEQVHLSPDGRQAVFTLRGDIWMMPANGGDATRLTSGPTNDQWPRFSPDAQQIAYFSDKNGNHDLFLLDLKTKRSRQLTRNRAPDHFHNWSPDGKTLVFCSERTGNKDIWTLELASGRLTQLTKHPTNDDDPAFSPDGAQIVFDSGREGAQAIYVMDKDGKNIRRVSEGPGHYQVPSFSPDGKMLVFEVFNPGSPRSGGLRVMAATGGPSMQISRDGSTACWGRDHIYFTANRGPHGNGVFRVKAPTSVVAGERVPFVGRVEVDRRKELENLFDEAWTALKNGFYDPKMHGLKWADMKKKYRAMAIDAENKDEFHNVVRQMLAELGASHLGIGGGARDTGAAPKIKETGHLGLDFEQGFLPDGGRRILSVLPGGPADASGLRNGDVILKINGKPLKPKLNLDKVLAGTVGKETKVVYRPLSGAGLGVERTAEVKPVDLGKLRSLKQEEWVASCARRVEKATKTKKREVAYIHLNMMNRQNLVKFQQAVQRWNKKRKIKGLILDVRNNGGGNIHQQLMAIFFARPLAEVRPRGMEKVIQPGLYWEKPVVVLINERSFSDAEVFPFMFKKAGAGTLIGVPTAGGVIGTQDITLSDGSTFRIPRTGFYDLDGTNLEGLGVKPDILVEETSEDRLHSRDPQLDKAIEVILKQIDERAKTEKATKKKPEPEPKPEAPQPEVAPEPEPATPSTVPAGVDPLKDTRVGEWVRYRLVTPGTSDETIFKVSVVEVKDGVVVFEKEVEKGAPVLPPLPDRMRQVSALEALGMLGELKDHTVVQGKIKETETEILMATVKWPDGSTLKLMLSEVIPAYGLWKVERDNVVTLEAIEWGVPETEEVVSTEPEPAPKTPETEKPAEQTAPPHPMRDVKVGEWVKIRRTGPNDMSVEMTQRVAEVTEDEIVVDATIEFGGRTMERTMRQERKKILEPPPQVSDATFSRDTLTVGETELECVVMTFPGPDGSEIKYWFSDTIPVSGLARIERDGVVISEVVEWGVDED